ncbi:hypothetical protein GIB67_029072 [Kingdonia uniflora]|uniref:Protein kinase domain-containing protein n=1 Tax=Kingdonia uniflora TaxID=39325 RepID=A0A7J7N6T8_9MAGN|nr:hypothetical protein GIB67_029072 [Kingdonia uniflora]
MDIKPENILLDEKFRAVLSDFGISKLTNEDENEVHTKMIRGTAGYMAPELFLGNQISDKCDIYSYGKKSLVNRIDKRLINGGGVDEKEVSSLVHAALWCLEEDPNNRPAEMRKVLYMLEAGKPDGIGAMVDRLAEGKVPSANGGLLVIKLHGAQNIEVITLKISLQG